MRAALVVALAACGPPKHPPPSSPMSPVTVDPIPATPKPAKPAAAIPTRSSDVVVAITGTKINMNGREISGTPMVADLVAVFGKYDRTWNTNGSGNLVHTWDALGLVVYEPRDGTCISATFPYKPMSQTFDPKTKFAGTMVVDGKRFTPRTDLATVKTWPGATMPYSPSSVVFDKGDIHVFTIEESPGSVDLVEISFWQRGRDVPETRAHGRTRSLELECSSGDARMCTRLALIALADDRDLPRALRFAQHGCDGKDAFACTMLGNMHEAGAGTKRSHADAKLAWQRACSLGDPVGCERAK